MAGGERDAIEAHLSDERSAELDRQIVAGYERVPQAEEELGWADAEPAR